MDPTPPSRSALGLGVGGGDVGRALVAARVRPAAGDVDGHLDYGTPAVLEELLEVNPRLASAPPRLPGGTLVDLPPSAAAPPAPAISLWD